MDLLYLIHSHSSGLQVTQSYRWLHILQLTVTHALGFSVLSNHILATYLQQSHCHFKLHVESSLSRRIPFLAFLLSHLLLPSPELYTLLILSAWDPLYLTLRRTYRKHRFLYRCEGVFTAPLYSNGSYSIVACVFIAAGMCLPSPCISVGMYFTIL
jgi:hypothetical protein